MHPENKYVICTTDWEEGGFVINKAKKAGRQPRIESAQLINWAIGILLIFMLWLSKKNALKDYQLVNNQFPYTPEVGTFPRHQRKAHTKYINEGSSDPKLARRLTTLDELGNWRKGNAQLILVLVVNQCHSCIK